MFLKNVGPRIFTNKNKIKQYIVKYFSIEDYYNKRLNSNVQKSRHNIAFNEAFAKTKQAPNCWKMIRKPEEGARSESIPCTQTYDARCLLDNHVAPVCQLRYERW